MEADSVRLIFLSYFPAMAREHAGAQLRLEDSPVPWNIRGQEVIIPAKCSVISFPTKAASKAFISQHKKCARLAATGSLLNDPNATLFFLFSSASRVSLVVARPP